MSPFDSNDKKKPSGRDDSRDFNRDENSSFMKDKRPRINRSSADRITRDGNSPQERRSFNPNFNKDNRKTGYNRDDRNRDDRFNRSDYGAKPGGRQNSRDDDNRFNRTDYQERPPKPRSGNDSRSETGGGYKKPWNKDDSRGSTGGYKKPWSGNGPKPEGGYNKGGYNKNAGPGRGQGYNKSKGGGFKKRDDSNTYTSENYPRYKAPKAVGAIRLNRFIANSGICSRREADELIGAGVVTVNGQVVTEMGSKVNPGDEVRFNGEIVRGEPKVYIVMNKSKGFVTTIEDPHADKTVIDIVKNICQERVYPVGRLDKNSVGVLLITNDGELTKQLTHPSSNKKKIYQVTLDKSLTQADMKRLTDGIDLEDGRMFFDEVSYVRESKKDIGVEVHSGRNRIVRRMFEALGYVVQKLDRVYFAGITKKGLKRGAWRFLTPQEVSMLKSGEYR